ncbi:MAG: sugar phosphate isomerase/epimerase [Desulfobacterales bacterium]|nr:MAG: sugar phosphate isomerase/epimerase [Desulfobacterales bacterium]
MYPALSRSYKGQYPFRLGTTSFIYPDVYGINVKMLGPYLDEIELLLLESTHPGSLPSPAAIRELARLAEDFELTYNVHLPSDIAIGHPAAAQQQRAVDILLQVFERVAPLAPTTHTLHIAGGPNSSTPDGLEQWRQTAHANLKKLLAAGIRAEKLSIETLDYPFEWVEDLIDDLDLRICIDLGHLIKYGYNEEASLEKYYGRTTIMHLHGVEDQRDHLSLDRLPQESIAPVLRKLGNFSGTVSLEVFSFEDLQASLTFFHKCWQRRTAACPSLR